MRGMQSENFDRWVTRLQPVDHFAECRSDFVSSSVQVILTWEAAVKKNRTVLGTDL